MKKEWIKDLLLITIGAFIYAFGVNYFFVPNQIADGGFAGISMLLYYLFEFNISTTYIVLNIPVIILGYKLIGGKFIIKTFYGTAITSLALHLLENFGIQLDSKFIAAIFGGLFMGTGLGAMFIGGGSSGGSDILVKIMNKYFKISIGKAFLLLDSVVITTTGFLFGKEVFFYTLLGVFITTKAIDFLQDCVYKTDGVVAKFCNLLKCSKKI